MLTEYVGERRSGINPSVVDDVTNIFKGKTLVQLKGLQQSIQAKLDGGEGVDIGEFSLDGGEGVDIGEFSLDGGEGSTLVSSVSFTLGTHNIKVLY